MQQEVLNLRESITYGLKQQMAEGKLTGFTGCLGYDYNSETQELTIIKEEAEIVRKIFEMYANGYGVEKIKQCLEIISNEFLDIYNSKRGDDEDGNN